jgi:hypothetical protein
MRIIWPEGNLGSKRSGILAIFIGALASAMLLAAGCAGDRTADQAAAEAVATISADATNESTAPSTRKSPHTTVGAKSTTTDLSTGSSATSPVKGASPTTRRQGSPLTTRSATTKPKPSPTKPKPTATTKPEVELTVVINNIVAVKGQVGVSPGGHLCASTCSYSYPEGEDVAFRIANEVEVFTGWEVSGGGGGQTTCVEAASSCTLTLNDDATVTANFGA